MRQLQLSGRNRQRTVMDMAKPTAPHHQERSGRMN